MHDNNGNMLDNGEHELGYDILNRLTSVDGIEYTYNGNGLMRSKTVDGVTTTFVYDGTNIVAEITDDVIKTYFRGLRLISTNNGKEKLYYHHNSHGDVTKLTNATGAVVESYTYDAFGNQLTATGNNPFRYCGEYYDTDTGYIYLRARWYAPEIGRFISEDPMQDGMNWYVYGNNNPLRYIDPTGLAGFEFTLGAKGQHVKDVQWMLKNLGYLGADGKALTIDGVFGNNTLYAVNQYKNAHGLWNHDQYRGVVGDTTFNHMRDKLYSTPESDWYSNVVLAAEHTKGARKSTQPKHEKGQSRKQTDAPGGEKGDARRAPRKDPKKIEIVLPEPKQNSAPQKSPWQTAKDNYNGFKAWVSGACRGGTTIDGQPITCFTGDTLVKTENGLIPIKDIRVGDMVYSYDTESGEIEYKKVTEFFSNNSKQMIYITIDDEVIEATPEHPIYVEGVGWVGAGALSIGDEVKLSSSETATVERIERVNLKTSVAVYNFNVEDYNNYFVSELEVLVHSRCR